MTRAGAVYGLPTWVPLTDDSGFSLLLKTPTSQLAVNGGSQHPDKRKEGGHGPTLADEVEHLLPTPIVSDGTVGPKNLNGALFAPQLREIKQLLPTPKASDGMMGTPSTTGRPVEMATFLSTQAMLLAGHLEHRRTGATTHPQYDVGKQPPAA